MRRLANPEKLNGLGDMWIVLNSELGAIREYVEERSSNEWPERAIDALLHLVSYFQTVYRLVAKGIPAEERRRFRMVCIQINSVMPKHCPFMAAWPTIDLDLEKNEPVIVHSTLMSGPWARSEREGYLSELEPLISHLYSFLQEGGHVAECEHCALLMKQRQSNHRFCSHLCRQHYSAGGYGRLVAEQYLVDEGEIEDPELVKEELTDDEVAAAAN